jgi:tetratricopeptide (TPR) repeat protein
VWLVEGFATFMQTAQVQKDGSVLFGAAPEERAWGLLSSDSIPLPTLLTEGYAKLNDAQRDLFYGEGWLLTHYLYSATSRSGQLTRYLDLLNSGTPRLDAARQAFGDLNQLQHDLTIYKHQSSLLATKIGADHTQAGAVDVTPLSPGGAAVILLRADLKLHGTRKDAAGPLAQQIRAIEARFPGDELVEATLAEAELDVGDAAAAEAAADRALKANPKDVEALIYKGRAIAERGRTLQGAERHQIFEQARALFITANKIDTEDPEPLDEYYKSYLLEGVRPNDNAIAAMHYASDLVPQDSGLRMNSAIAYLNENKLKEARATLAPVAYSPHGGVAAEFARTMIAKIDEGDAKGALMALRKPADAPAK